MEPAKIEALEGYVAIGSGKETRCDKCCFELNSDQCLKMLCYEGDRKSGRSVYFLMNANKTNEIEAEVSRLKSELKVAQNNLAHLGRYQMEVSRLTEENEKLKADRCDAIKDLVNAEKFIDQQGSENNSFEARISAIEKFLVEKHAFAEQNGKTISEFKPGGEGNG